MAAVGGMAFFVMMSRYYIGNCAAETELGGAGGKSDANPAPGVTCNEKMCGPKQGEVLKGENELTVSDEQWRKKLTPEQFNVTRRKGTEPAFTRRLLELPQGRHLPLCLLRHAAVQLGHEV